MKEKIYLFDTTLRDGQQTQGVDFSVADKTKITKALDALGIDYIEGGWPGANPTDNDFFDNPPVTRAVFTAFGMTKRAGRSAANDEILSAVLNAKTPAVCLVGKTHDFHVTKALGISLEENLENIDASIRELVKNGREAIFDCEHFFDGFRANPQYALKAAKTAYDAGARWVVMCDTNGGALPEDIEIATKAVIDCGIPGAHLGIHAHNDTEHAVANSLTAISHGVRQIQGTLNGLGERCGNANLMSLIGILSLKEPYASRFSINVSEDQLRELTALSRMLDDILNRVPLKQAAFVGASAFAHKAGLHASAVIKDPSTYEHVVPEKIGNKRIVPMSNQAGTSNLIKRLEEIGIATKKGDPRLSDILRRVKEAEDQGFAFDTAQASFELLARDALDIRPQYFDVTRYRVSVERRLNAKGHLVSFSEAVVVVNINGAEVMSVADSLDPSGEDRGPVFALSQALSKDLGPYQSAISDMKLVDYKVRITNGGTEAVTRVIIDSEDSAGQRWATVGVSANIVDASFQALLDSINWKLIRDHVS